MTEPLRICADTAALFAMPYALRQFIVVVNGATLDAISAANEQYRRHEQERLEAENQDDAKDDPMWEDALHWIRRARPRIDVSSAPLVEGLLDNVGKIGVLSMGDSTASSLVFPPGHPRYDLLYVGHPVLAGTYYTVASFHRLTFEHKFSEALELLMALGATHVRVERITGWSREFGMQAGTPGLEAVEGKAAAGKVRSSDSRIFFEADLRGADVPGLPENLVWYQHEPTWRAIAEGRLKYGIKNFKLIIEYADDFNVNLDLSVTAAKAGLSLGGKFTDFQATIWHMDGQFPD